MAEPEGTGPAAGRGLVAFVLPDLRAGGVERITIELMREFCRRGFRVDLVLLRARGELLEHLPAGVQLFDLGKERIRSAIMPLRAYFRSRRPDAVRAAMWSLTSATLLAAIGLRHRPRVVVSEHSLLSMQYGKSLKGRAWLRASMVSSYRLADGIVAVSDGVAGDVSALSLIPRRRIVTIPNPVAQPTRSGQDSDAVWGGAGGKRILTVGQLKPVKNHAMLLEAFEHLAAGTDATLAIVGDGPLRDQLERDVRERKLDGRVLLPGYSATPADWYAGADLFVLSSDFEGFGNVLVEALQFGLPVVSTDCPGGPAEILGHGRWGRLVAPGDAGALAAAMAQALTEPVDRAARRERAGEFTLVRAADAYQALLFQS